MSRPQLVAAVVILTVSAVTAFKPGFWVFSTPLAGSWVASPFGPFGPDRLEFPNPETAFATVTTIRFVVTAGFLTLVYWLYSRVMGRKHRG